MTHLPADNSFEHWSPDGLRIAFLSNRTGRLEAWLVARDRVGGPWHEAVQLTDFGCFSTYWAPDGSGVLCVVQNGFVLVSAAGEVMWRRNTAAAGFSDVDPWVAMDRSSLYLSATRAGRRGNWTWPLAGGEPRLLVAHDDPLLVPEFMSVHGDHLYLTVAQNESDIWVMDLKR